MEIAARIGVDEKVCVLANLSLLGTRVPVDLILGKLAGGDDLRRSYG